MKLTISISKAGEHPGGTVQDLVCLRNGDERWRKKVYIPHNELEEFQDKFLMKTHGAFLYDSNGEIKVVKKRPRGVPHWKE